ncbi:MAG: DUF4347 domain-containing protein [Magnetococcales bacterium]|nr:DUF4347 domain-containing protein [Magnetococcales bacterium]
MKHIVINQSIITPPPATTPDEIVFIDAAVPDQAGLLSGIPTHAQVVRLDANRDGIAQITETLEKHQNLSTVHIFSHGSSGALQLGSTTLSSETLPSYQDALRTWNASLAPNADLLLYGCDVAQGERGTHFVQELSRLTGADMAASTDRTGVAGLGGDWDLEQQVGEIETAALAVPEWQGVLTAGVLTAGVLTAGVVTTDFDGYSDRVNDMAVQSDGKILVAGYTLNSRNNQDFAIVRYNTNGSLDTTFDSDGKLTTDLGGRNDYGTSIAVQTDGKILVAGYTYNGRNNDFAIVRYNVDGTLDATFGSAGKVIMDYDSDNDQINGMCLQPDSKILVTGGASTGGRSSSILLRYDTNGVLDSEFGDDGKFIYSAAGINHSVALQSDGKILLFGQVYNRANVLVERVNADGSLDSSFGENGLFSNGQNLWDGTQGGITVQTDDKILIVGGYWSYWLERLHANNGELDTRFDGDGFRSDDLGMSAQGVVVQLDGQILVGGSGGMDANNFVLARYNNTNGSFDTTFDRDGKLTATFGAESVFGAIALQADGKILVTGANLSSENNYDFAVARYNTNGTLDSTFNPPVAIPVTVTLSGPASITEGNSGNSNATYTVSLSSAATSAVMVNYATTGVTATAGVDFGSIGNILVIAAGSTSATFTVPIMGDATSEENETFTVALSNPNGATLGTTSSVTTTITNDDSTSTGSTPRVTLSGPATISEGNSGSSNATYTITLSAASSAAVMVMYSTASGTATAGVDFGSISNLVTIAAGSTSATFTVPILGDTANESNETFTVALTNAIGASLGTTSSVTTTISNDDVTAVTPTLTLSGPATINEGNSGSSNATYTVALSSAVSSAVTVIYSTVEGTATGGIDFSSTGNLLTIAAGRTSATFTVPVLGDTMAENRESFTVSLLSPSGATLGTTTTVTTAIVDDDSTSTPDDNSTGSTGSGNTVQSATSKTLGSGEQNLTLTGTAAINGIGNSMDNLITGNSAANTLQGESGADRLLGGAGNDILYGGSGNDTLNGGTGADRLLGGTDDDIYVIDNSGDTISEEADSGIDLVQSSITWTLGNNLENLTLTGSSAINGTGNAGNNLLSGNSSDNTLTGGDGNDTLNGNAGDDTLNGGAGVNLLNGGAGADRMIGGNGNDTFVVNNSGDVVTESANSGTDLVQSSITWTLATNAENLTLTGSNAINGTGNGQNNTLRGNGSANTLRGLAGDDSLYGAAGEDTLNGGDGNDKLSGGSGLDTITGGAGMDQFKFTQSSEGGDTISDFSVSQGDQLVFVSQNFGNLAVGKLGTSRLGLNSTGRASNSSQRFVFNTSTGVLKYDSDGNGSAAGVTMATLSGVSTLSVNQIQIVAS